MGHATRFALPLQAVLVYVVAVSLHIQGCRALTQLAPPITHGALFTRSLTSRRSHGMKLKYENYDINTLDATRAMGVQNNDKTNDHTLVTADRNGAGVMSSTFNLAKSIIGMGVLSLPSGLAYGTDDRSAIIPAALMCALFGALSAHSFSIIGQVCDTYNTSSYSDAYRATVSNTTAVLVPVIITTTCLLNTLACSIMIGDSFSDIFRAVQAPAFLNTRNGALAALSTFILAPLCSLQSLKSLAPFSVMGLIGTLFTAVVMGIRFFDGGYSYSNFGDDNTVGRFLIALQPAHRPSFNVIRRNNGEWLSLLRPASFVLLSMFNTAYVAHYHAPRIYSELQEKSVRNFKMITQLSFGLSALVFVAIMSLGFLTFGGNSNGFILNNYATTDSLATASRFAVGVTLLSGYPILFSALKDGIKDLFGLQKLVEQRPIVYRLSEMALLAGASLLAMRIRDVSFLVSFAGALCGSMLMFVFPALMSISMENINEKNTRGELLSLEYSLPYREKYNPDQFTLDEMDKLNKKMFQIRMKMLTSYLMLFMGVAMSVVGVLVCSFREMEIMDFV